MRSHLGNPASYGVQHGANGSVSKGSADVYARYGCSAAIRSGDLIFVSGQVGAGCDGTAIEDRRAQIEQAFENLKQVLDAAGCSMSGIVDITLFHVDMFSHFEIFRAEKRKAFPTPPCPNWTAVGVTTLADPALVFEIKAIARIP